MSLTNIKNMRAERGFTIVELLIVVVIIGILAAIVLVSYNGLTNRAKSSSAQSTGSSIQKKLEAYYAEKGNYPADYALMDDTPSASWYIPTGTYNVLPTTSSLSNTSSEKDFEFFNCSGGGKRIETRDYANNTDFTFDVGGCTGTVTRDT